MQRQAGLSQRCDGRGRVVQVPGRSTASVVLSSQGSCGVSLLANCFRRADRVPALLATADKLHGVTVYPEPRLARETALEPFDIAAYEVNYVAAARAHEVVMVLNRFSQEIASLMPFC